MARSRIAHRRNVSDVGMNRLTREPSTLNMKGRQMPSTIHKVRLCVCSAVQCMQLWMVWIRWQCVGVLSAGDGAAAAAVPSSCLLCVRQVMGLHLCTHELMGLHLCVRQVMENVQSNNTGWRLCQLSNGLRVSDRLLSHSPTALL